MDRLVSPKTKRVLLVVLAVTLVALAGCNTGGDTTTVPNETLTDGDETTTAPQTTQTESETTDGPETTTTEIPESDIDPAVLASEHASQVAVADSLTTGQRFVVQQNRNGSTTVYDSRVASYLDFENSTGLQNSGELSQSSQGSQSRSVDFYTAGNETFARLNTSMTQEAQYFYGTEPYEDTQLSPVDFANASTRTAYDDLNVSLQLQGETEFDNETVHEYTATGQDRILNLVGIDRSAVQVDRINATFLVTDDGLITSTEIQATGVTANGVPFDMAFQRTVTDVNATTVEEPAWTSDVNTTG